MPEFEGGELVAFYIKEEGGQHLEENERELTQGFLLRKRGTGKWQRQRQMRGG
jgi:hypothetical protein